MKILTLKQAAEFLGMNREVLRRKAKAGEIPGTKELGDWRFIDDDLVSFLRGSYPSARVLQGQEEQCCEKSKAVRITTLTSRLQTEKEYESLLKPPIELLR
jgi:hypothetical protein